MKRESLSKKVNFNVTFTITVFDYDEDNPRKPCKCSAKTFQEVKKRLKSALKNLDITQEMWDDELDVDIVSKVTDGKKKIVHTDVY